MIVSQGFCSHFNPISGLFSKVIEAVSILMSLFGFLPMHQHFLLVKLQTRWAKLQAKHVFKQLADGVEHMHRHQIIHRDLKLENILIHSKEDCLRINLHQWNAKSINIHDNMHSRGNVEVFTGLFFEVAWNGLDWYGLVPPNATAPRRMTPRWAGIGWLQALRGQTDTRLCLKKNRSNRKLQKLQRFISDLQVKITDFGSSSICSGKSFAKGPVGTPPYMAPELLFLGDETRCLRCGLIAYREHPKTFSYRKLVLGLIFTFCFKNLQLSISDSNLFTCFWTCSAKLHEWYKVFDFVNILT